MSTAKQPAKPRAKKHPVKLTHEELSEIVICLDIGLKTGDGYGHITRPEQNIAEDYRRRLMNKLERLLASMPEE